MSARSWQSLMVAAAILAVCVASTVHAAGKRWRWRQVSSATAMTSAQPTSTAVTNPNVPAAKSAVAVKELSPTQRKAAVADILLLRAAAEGGAASANDEAEFAAALRELAGDRSPAAQLQVSPATDDHDVLTALRLANKHFERQAAQLEDKLQFTAADQARRTAEALRLEARRLSQQAPHPPVADTDENEPAAP